jgi:ABC-2 type transport system ATP-binding protein
LPIRHRASGVSSPTGSKRSETIVAAEKAPIEIAKLSKTYRLGFWMGKKVHALKSLDLSVGTGQVFGLLGPNGAGKSTTIKILMDLVRPTSGSARVFGLEPGNPEARRCVGFLPENPAPYDYLTGREFVTLSGQMAGMGGQELQRRVEEVIDDVQMIRAASMQIRRYSKGMVQRIALAQAIVARPKLLILDEPTSGLDPVGRRQMRDLILRERDRGTTVLFCTHIIPDVEALCDRVAVLVAGSLVQEGSVRELVTAKVPLVELGVENVGRERLESLGIPGLSVQQIGERLTVRASDGDAQVLLRKVLDMGGRVTHVQPVRFSLEDLFMSAVTNAGHTNAGGEIK